MKIAKFFSNTLVASLLALAATTSQAQTPAPAAADSEINQLKNEVRRLRDDFDLMKGQIGRIIQFMQQRDAPNAASQAPQNPRSGGLAIPAAQRVTIAGAPILGRADAPVTIVEFSDFECPFCQRFSSSILPQVKRDYVDTGKVRYVFLDLPLEHLHPQARKAAEAAHCSAEQGKFWEMHDLLFAQAGKLDPRQYTDFSRKLGMDAAAFDLCLGSGRHAAKIDRNKASASAIGIDATPSFILSKSERGDIINGGMIVTGADSYDQFRKLIEQVLVAK